jgi:4-aminobutyrate aminotransferase-like enzyme
MGNGHPVAAVLTRRAIADALVKAEGVFFSTFGGNPVSCAAAHAVLDVLEDEKVRVSGGMRGLGGYACKDKARGCKRRKGLTSARGLCKVLPRTLAAGHALRAAVTAATMPRFPCVGAVRGSGLAVGIEFVADARLNLAPDAVAAGACKRGLRARGVLVGTAGPFENVLKVRPPLAFTVAEVPLFVAALVATLTEMEHARERAPNPKARL